MKEKWIWFDMDGTIADLYGVDNWLSDLRSYNTRPYAEAKPMYDMVELIEVLANLKIKGYSIGVISWLSKDPNVDYGCKVAKTKKNWLAKWCFDLVLDKILITPYGVRKADTCRAFGSGILIDDEEPNRNAWNLGRTINANENILEILKNLLTE